MASPVNSMIGSKKCITVQKQGTIVVRTVGQQYTNKNINSKNKRRYYMELKDKIFQEL